jgi:hypothetical protein
MPGDTEERVTPPPLGGTAFFLFSFFGGKLAVVSPPNPPSSGHHWKETASELSERANYGVALERLVATIAAGARFNSVAGGGCCMTELFEVVETRVPIGEQTQAREEYDVRFARWRGEIQAIEKARRGCKGAVSDDRSCPPGA